MRILEIKTVQTNPIKQLFEALKEILTDVNIEFNESGIKIVAMDSYNTILVHLKLSSNKFDKYECKAKTIAGVSMSNLFKLLKTMNNDDTLTFIMDDNNINILTIILENGTKNKKTKYDLNLLDIDSAEIDIPDQEFDSILTMPSSEFQKICRDMYNLSNTIEIKNIGETLIFCCEGEFAKQETVIGKTTNNISFLKTTENDDIIQGYYNLKDLVLLTKCTNMCNSIEIYMKNNYPIFITYSVGNLGKLKLALSPRVEL